MPKLSALIPLSSVQLGQCKTVLLCYIELLCWHKSGQFLVHVDGISIILKLNTDNFLYEAWQNVKGN